jgi:Arc/MetJ-type ribon-helix-helix transcriptional regulator
MNVFLNKDALTEHMWFQHIKTMTPEYIKIIGRVVGRVSIRDIGYEVSHNQIISIPVSEANKSQDLVTALAPHNKWVEIVSGQEYLQKPQSIQQVQVAPVPVQHVVKVTTQVQEQQQPVFDVNGLRDFATQIAQAAADSAANKSVESIRSMLTDMSDKIGSGSNLNASDVVNELLKKMPQGQTIQQSTKTELDKQSEKLFIGIDTDKTLETNISGNLGDVTVKKDLKAKSAISKLKQIKH